MDGDQIRQTFFNFFEEKGHMVMPSSSLVPAGDPTLLFTSAGMVQFKPYFMGEITPPSKRLVSCQKSFRTTDVDDVGDHKHLTFFEMLGNFSIGDYFKKDAIAWCWEFVTQRFNLDPERLYATIYLDDEEAYRHWTEDIGVPPERVYRYGDEDNWWGPAGREGPCGPCSEIHYDSGIERGCGTDECHPNHDCERFVELWNLVFMQFYQDLDGVRTPLPAPSIDTGLGLERAAAVLQGTPSLYETDLFQPIVRRVTEISGREYGADRDTDYAIRVVAEHARAASFLIGDGVVPGNEGRGYVLRRIIRRAIRYGRRLGLEERFLTEVAAAAINRFQHVYRDLSTHRDFIMRVISEEEERFDQTFERGITILEGLLVAADQETGRPSEVDRPLELAGRDAFSLYDTYGFPPELTAEIARERGMEVDMEGFGREMQAQRERGRAANAFTGAMEMLPVYEGLGIGASLFVGYDHLAQETEVVALLVDGEARGHALAGQRVEVVLRDTPFYSEGGGQVGDAGEISAPNGRLRVEDTQSPVAGLIVHIGTVEEGEISVGDAVKARVDASRRLDTTRNHSATHLLHASLRQVLGTHVRQAGSFVAPDKLRFDYSHVSPLSRDELLEVQGLANTKVRDDLRVSTRQSSFTGAVQEGALAFFGDRYGDSVRVVEMSDGEPFSLEVCGGTHVGATGQIGALFLVGESSIGGGMRRVEAVSGRAAEAIFQERSGLLESIAQRLQTPVVDLESRMDGFLQDMDRLQKRLATLERENNRREAQELLQKVQDVDGMNVLAARTSAATPDAMREMGDWLKDRLASAVIVLAGVQEDRPIIVCMVTPDLVAKGVHAGDLARETARVVGGGGGGRPEMAQAGGKSAAKLDEALRRVPEVVKKGAGR